MKLILQLILLLILILILVPYHCYAIAVQEIILGNTDSDTSFRPVGYCNTPAISFISTLSTSPYTYYDEGYNNAIDTTNGFAYFSGIGSDRIVKIRLSDFTNIGNVNLGASGTYGPEGLSIDTTNSFLYTATTTALNKINKINLSTFTLSGTITLSPTTQIFCSAVDSANGFLYLGSDQGIVVKVSLATFTETARLDISANVTNLRTVAIDNINGFIYFGGGFSGGIAKIRLSDFTYIGKLTLATSNIGSMVIDSSGSFMYASTANTLNKIRLSDFTSVGSLSFAAESCLNLLYDSANNYLYWIAFNGSNSPRRINLSTFTQDAIGTGIASVNSYEAVIDVVHQFIYFSSGSTPNTIKKVDICGD